MLGRGRADCFIGAMDPRIKAVVPACFINSYQLLFAGPDPDTEMSFPDLFRVDWTLPITSKSPHPRPG